MTNSDELRGLLQGFTGSGVLFAHWAGLAQATVEGGKPQRFLYTDGVQAFIDHAGNGAYWFLDIVMTEPAIVGAMKAEGFIVVTLNVKDGKASLTAARDVGEPNAFERWIPYTDCPEGEWRFYFVSDVLMLPREY